MRPDCTVSTRRVFLQHAAAGLGGLLAGAPAALAAAKKPLALGEFKKRLRGPILSFPNCYTADFKLDFRGMGALIEMALKAGVQVVTLTAGNNQYDRLTYDEIKSLTRFVVETVAGRAATMAATGPWWTAQAVAYARFAQEVGADALQVLLPNFGEEDGHFEHMKAVAGATSRGLALHGQPSLRLMKRLLTLDAVVAFKEEFTTIYTLPFFKEFGERLNIFAGGEKARFLTYQPYGMQAYYSTFVTFAPAVAVRFWKSVLVNDLKQAHRIVLDYDVPFFEKWSHPFWRATLEYFGVASRWVRPPEASYSDKQMQEVAAFYQGLGLHPEKR